MNRISAIALFVAAGFATVLNASAATRLSETTVPFAFTVNGTTLPAGTYIVNSLSPNLVQISSTDTRHPNTVTVLTREGAKMNPAGSTELVFAAYGNQYFLHEIVAPLRSTDAVVPVSREEKKARVEWASKSGGSEPVLVALK